MASLASIRAGFKSVLQSAFPGFQVTGYLLASPTVPAFEVDIAEEGITYDLAMQRGADDWMFVVRAIVSEGVSDLGAQKNLDTLLSSGSGSVKAVLEAAPTLPVNGTATVNRLQVLRATGPRRFVVGQTEYLGAEWSVRVIAS